MKNLVMQKESESVEKIALHTETVASDKKKRVLIVNMYHICMKIRP